jgi:hypothetical protein
MIDEKELKTLLSEALAKLNFLCAIAHDPGILKDPMKLILRKGTETYKLLDTFYNKEWYNNV